MLGTEMMMKTLISALGLDPEEIKKTVGNIGKVIVSFKEQMDRVENNQREIMRHLGIPQGGEIIEPKKDSE